MNSLWDIRIFFGCSAERITLYVHCLSLFMWPLSVTNSLSFPSNFLRFVCPVFCYTSKGIHIYRNPILLPSWSLTSPGGRLTKKHLSHNNWVRTDLTLVGIYFFQKHWPYNLTVHQTSILGSFAGTSRTVPGLSLHKYVLLCLSTFPLNSKPWFIGKKKLQVFVPHVYP